MRKPTKRERELVAELDQCRIERDQFRDGRNFLWTVVQATKAELAQLRESLKREAA